VIHRATILVCKSARTLTLHTSEGPPRIFEVAALGSNRAADKAVEGDCATPIGEFYVCAKNPRSRFFLSLCISYPNFDDAVRGLAAGLISPAEYTQITEAVRQGRIPPQHTRLGGEIYIHGLEPASGAGAGGRDSTRGCIALDNAAMREIYDAADLGSAVVIVA
jgi:murein L,D-transpeptidase YafK